MIKPISLKKFFLASGGKLVSIPGDGIQRVVRQMVKQSRPTRVAKKKRPTL